MRLPRDTPLDEKKGAARALGLVAKIPLGEWLDGEIHTELVSLSRVYFGDKRERERERASARARSLACSRRTTLEARLER